MKDISYMLQNGNKQVFLYSYDYSRPQAGEWWQEVGSFHNYDIFFIEDFIFPFYNYSMQASDRKLVDMWSEFFGNFATYDNPAPIGRSWYRWRPTSGRQNYFSFNAPIAIELINYHLDDVNFWNVEVSGL